MEELERELSVSDVTTSRGYVGTVTAPIGNSTAMIMIGCHSLWHIYMEPGSKYESCYRYRLQCS